MSLYKELLKEIRRGYKYEFNFDKGIMKVANKDFETDDNLISKEDLKNYYIDDLFSNPWDVAEMLYDIYYSSKGRMPRYPVFAHKEEEEMTSDELAFGEDRRFAEIQLEAYLMILGKLGKLDFGNGFFYQGITNKKFVVIKDWICK